MILPEPQRFTATEAFHHERLDKFLHAHMPEYSRSYLQQLIRDGQVTNGRASVTSPSHKVAENDSYSVTLPPPKPMHLEAEPIPLDVVYEDDYLLVINKPAGLTVHPGAGRKHGTLVHALLHHCKGQLSGIGGVERPGIVHRLDKDTTGLMVVAKEDKTHRALAEQLKQRALKRHYLAIVWGIPTPPVGAINAPLGRHPKDRAKRAVSKSGDARSAVTHYRVKQAYGTLASLVECELDTGRTHQIRVHMSHIGHPLVGDTSYGGYRNLSPHVALEEDKRLFVQNFPRQALHAFKLSFTHPVTGQALTFERNFRNGAPEDIRALDKVLQELKSR